MYSTQKLRQECLSLFYCFNGFKSVTMVLCQMGMWLSLVYTCCYSSLSTNHVGCPIMALNFSFRYSSIQSRASLTLLNIYYFRINIFKKGIFKRLFEKEGALSENFGGPGAPSAPPHPPPPPALEGLAYRHQTWQIGDLPWGAPIHITKWVFNYMV